MADTNKTVTQWDPGEVIVTVDNTPIEDFTAGEFINHTRTTPTRTAKIGLTGSAIVNRAHDRSATVTLNLHRSSPSNAYLSGLHIDGENGDGPEVHDLQIKDLRGSGLLSGRCIITQPPDWVADLEAPDFAWSLMLLNGDVEVKNLNPV